jgi:hypothetical protein
MMRTRHIHHLLAAAALATALFVPASSASAAAADDPGGFSVQPMIFDEDVTPGASASYAITITNADPDSTRFTFSKEDFEGDKDEPSATPVLMGGEFKSAISGYGWIDLPDPVTIPGGESRTVKVNVRPPSGATGGHYTAVLVNGRTTRDGSVSATSRIGVLFMMNAGGVPPPDIVITEIKEVGETTTQTVIRYTNPSGGTHVTPKPVVTTKDPITHTTTGRYEGECETALPGATAECTVNTDDSHNLVSDPDGPVTGLGEQQSISLIPGDDAEGSAASAKGELPTEWAGTWTSMLLPLVGIALFAMYFLFLRRRRKDEEDDAELATP